MEQNTTIPEGMDAGAVNLARAIRHKESGGDYNLRGDDNTSAGAYQWNNGDTPLSPGEVPKNFREAAKQYNLDPEDFSAKNQDMVAYHRIKELKDSGKNVLQVAAMWNHGTDKDWESAVGDHRYPDGKVIHYDTPAYVKAVNDYYQDLKAKSVSSNVDIGQGSTDGNPAPDKSLGQKVIDGLGTATGQKGFGEDVAGALTSVLPDSWTGKQQLDEAAKTHAQGLSQLTDLIKRYNAQGKDSTKLKAILADELKNAPPGMADLYPAINKTALQVIGDTASSVISIAGGALIPEVAGVSGRLAAAGVTGAGIGLTSGLGNGDTSFDSLAKDTGYGAVAGVATGGFLEGVGGAFKGVKNFITGAHDLTDKEILATAPEAVSKLTPREQSYYYKNQSQTLTQQAKVATEQAAKTAQESLAKTEANIREFNQKAATTIGDKAVELKQPAQQLMKDSSKEYTTLSGEAAENSPNLSKTLTHEDLSSKIDDKFKDVVTDSGQVVQDNSAIRDSLKKDLGLKPTAEGAKAPEMTNQEVLDKARGIMQEVSKSARGGNKVYSMAENQAMNKYKFLMDTLSENGVDMSEANKFWKQWAPVRDRIVREIKPFDEIGTGKMPIKTTLRQATVTPNTLAQTQSQQQAQSFINELETRMKLPKGTLTKDISEQIGNIEGAQLDKETIKKVQEETIRQIKADKVEALKTMSAEKFNNETAALKRERVRKAVIVTLKVLGIGAATSGAGYEVVKHL